MFDSKETDLTACPSRELGTSFFSNTANLVRNLFLTVVATTSCTNVNQFQKADGSDGLDRQTINHPSYDQNCTFQVSKDECLSPEQKLKLRETITKTLDGITLSAVQDGQSGFDKQDITAPVPEEYELTISKAQNLDNPIIINGRPVLLKCEIPTSLFPFPNDQNNHNAIEILDIYGNKIRVWPPYQSDDSFSVDICLEPTFSPSSEGKISFAPLEIDLTSIGLADISGIFVSKVQSPIATKERINFYANFDNAEASYLIDVFESIIRRGIVNAHELFEVHVIDAVDIPNKSEDSGSFADNRPNIITINRGTLLTTCYEDNVNSTELTAFHETIHAIDYKLKISEDPRLIEWFETFKDREHLFELVNESSHFKNPYIDFGHAENNSAELLASYITSAYYLKDSQRFMQSDNKDVQAFNCEFCELLSDILNTKVETGLLDPKAPIFSFLENLRQRFQV